VVVFNGGSCVHHSEIVGGGLEFMILLIYIAEHLLFVGRTSRGVRVALMLNFLNYMLLFVCVLDVGFLLYLIAVFILDFFLLFKLREW
jgi:hypothetical protein